MVKRASAGRGLFALEGIARGACIAEYTGRTLKEAEWNTSRSRYLFKVTEKKTIDGSNKKNLARYINHSCRPKVRVANARNASSCFNRGWSLTAPLSAVTTSPSRSIICRNSSARSAAAQP